MSRRFSRLVSGERGATAIVVAFMLLVLMGFAALSVDVGSTMWSRRAQQNAADAAALAGSHELPNNPAAAVDVALAYAADNGFPAASGQVTVTAWYTTRFNTNDSLVVTVTRRVPPGLRAAVLGGEIEVPALAEAIVAKTTPSCGFWPFTIARDSQIRLADGSGTPMRYDQSWGQQVILRASARGQVSEGNFGLVDVGSGADAIRDAIADPHDVCLEDELDTKPGAAQGPVRFGVLDALEGSLPGWTGDGRPPVPDNVYWQSDTAPYGLPYNGVYYCSASPTPSTPNPEVTIPSCSRVAMIPVIDTWTDMNGASTIPIVDVVGFYLLGIDQCLSPGEGNSCVVGSFLRQVSASGAPDYEQPLSGSLGYYLWK